MAPYTAPEPGGVDVAATLIKWLRAIADSLAFTQPFIAPAFIGAVMSVTRKSYRKKGFAYWVSAVCWSTAAGASLTPAFAHLAGLPDGAAGSTATLVALLGHEGVGWLCGHFKPSDPWDGVDRRNQGRTGNDDQAEQ